MKYSDYLLDPRWLALREIIKARDLYKCVVCDSKRNLNVHHKRYCGKPWESPHQDLITLCNDCHKKFHGITETSKTIIKPKAITPSKTITAPKLEVINEYQPIKTPKKKKRKLKSNYKDIDKTIKLNFINFCIKKGYFEDKNKDPLVSVRMKRIGSKEILLLYKTGTITSTTKSKSVLTSFIDEFHSK